MKICIQVTTNANKLVRMHKRNDLIFFFLINLLMICTFKSGSGSGQRSGST